MKAAQQESSENYLETILMLNNQGNPVRAVDIANEMDFTRPSVSIAMKKLREKNYITVDADSYISLTESGREIAESMYERHMAISNWLMSLGVDEVTARADACKMEHVTSDQSFIAIKKSINGG